jgi:release factor glutamine methyltransferase
VTAEDSSDGSDGSGCGRPALSERRDVPTVYQPAADSRLLAKTAVEYVDGGLVCDVGVGSGYVARRLADETGAQVFGTDRSRPACEQAHDAGVSAVQANLVAPFPTGIFDAVVFNPPYLPTPSEREWDDPLEWALSGGEDGRAVIEPFLHDVGRSLAPDGQVLLLVSTLTGVEAVRAIAAEAGLVGETVAEESHPFEQLVVLRLRPK